MRPRVVSVEPDAGGRRHPLLFVHGAWHGAWCWERFLPWFAARGWHCLAFDLRNHGESPAGPPLWRTRIRHYVEDLAEVVESLDEPPILVAHSMGGLVAQRYLEDHPLPHAVLLAPVPLGGVTGATLRVARRHPLKFLKANLTANLKPLIESRRVARSLLFTAEMEPAAFEQVWPRLQGESYLAYLEMLFTVRPRPQLVSTPVTVIAASEDRIFSVGSQRRTAVAYGTDLDVVTGAAHDLMLGPRWETVAKRIRVALESATAQ